MPQPLVPMAISLRGKSTTWICSHSIAIDRCYEHTNASSIQYVLFVCAFLERWRSIVQYNMAK